MNKVIISQTKQQIFCQSGDNLRTVLLKAGVFIESPCAGKGLCGKCKVKIVSGNVSSMTKTEKDLLGKDEIQQGIRLACLTEVDGDVELEILYKERTHKVLTKGYLPNFERENQNKGYGVVVDIGTTTVVLGLIHLASGKEIATASALNAQKQYGLDVLSRITYEYENPEDGVQQLQKTIVQLLNQLLYDVCVQARIDRKDVKEIDISANCTMMHMLLGEDAKSIGRAPYKPVFTEAKRIRAKEIGIEAGEDTMLYCLPAVSAYIGADIVAGAYVCELQKETGNVLFVDIGTNGEIVLTVDGRLFCCSCAAGPALEGMNISSGMRASEGAIEDVYLTETGIQLEIIGEQEPIGICGSGILAAIREGLNTKIIKKNGVFIKKETLEQSDYRYSFIRKNGNKREFLLSEDPEIVVTQADVRQVQLAKGAILSGFVGLLNQAGICMEELQKVIVAGQFGSHLPKESLIGVGILPREVEERLVYVGNSSKTGAYMALMSETVKKEMEELAQKMEYIELSQIPNYEQIFAKSMIFPEEQ